MKKSRKSQKLLLLTALFTTACVCQTPTYANSQNTAISIVFEGEQISYTTVQPTILNDYILVPIRETAELFGITTSWDFATSTMSFEKDGNISYHKVSSPNLTVNSEFKTYDTSSAIINNYTVMPIRMIADILNADIYWQPETATVHISKESIISNENPDIFSVSLDKNHYVVGDSMDFRISTSYEVSKIKILDENDEILFETEKFYDFTDERIFNFKYSPVSETADNPEVSIWKVFTGNENGFNETAYYEVPVSISQTLEILNTTVTKSALSGTPHHIVSVEVTDAVDSIKVTNNFNSSSFTQTAYTTSDGERVFIIQLEDLGFEQNPIYTLTPLNGETVASSSYELKLNQNDITSDTAVHFAEINHHDLRISYAIEIDLLTDGDVTSFKFKTGDGSDIPMYGEHLAGFFSKKNQIGVYQHLLHNGYKEFKVYFDLHDLVDDVLTIYSYGRGNDYSIRTINVIDDRYYIAPLVAIDLTSLNYNNKNNVELNVKTNPHVAEIIVTDLLGNEIASSTNVFNDFEDDRFRDFKFSFTVPETGTYKVTAILKDTYKDYDEYGEEILYSKFIEIN